MHLLLHPVVMTECRGRGVSSLRAWILLFRAFIPCCTLPPTKPEPISAVAQVDGDDSRARIHLPCRGPWVGLMRIQDPMGAAFL
eukprot:10596896-Alexandrium_andersonii.AAC.1